MHTRRRAAFSRPLIVVPGFMGSILTNPATGRRAWGSFFREKPITPYRGLIGQDEDLLDLPTSSADIRANRDSLVATGILDRITVIPHLLSVGIYSRWMKGLAAEGRTFGDLARPDRRADCYVFFYDWRRDMVESVQLLARAIDRVRAAHGDPDLQVDIAAHSIGGLIARYYLRYGGAGLAEMPPLESSHDGKSIAGGRVSGPARSVANLALIGAPNAGSMSSLMTLLYGRKIGPRFFPVLTWFSMPALFEAMPSPRGSVVLDERGEPTAVDIYDPSVWIENGWSVFHPERRALYRRVLVEHLGKRGEDALAAKYAEWERFLGAVLDRARRFQLALSPDAEAALPTRYHLMGSDCRPTLARGVMERAPDGSRVILSRKVTPKSMTWERYRALVLEPGDGIVTHDSLLGHPVAANPEGEELRPERPVSVAFRGADVLWECARHDRLQNRPRVQSRLRDAFEPR